MKGTLFLFFDRLEKHVDLHEDQSRIATENTHWYIDSLPIYEVFFDNISKSPEKNTIWEHHFPENWLVKSDTIDERRIAQKWFEYFIEWSNDEMRKSDFNKDLEEVSRGLFPEVDPRSWSVILTFLVRSSGDSRVKSLLKDERNFGFGSRIMSTSEQNEAKRERLIEKEQSTYRENSIQLVCKLFNLYPFVFQSFKNIDKHIEELESIGNEYEDDSEMDNYRKWVLEIFKEIKHCLEEK